MIGSTVGQHGLNATAMRWVPTEIEQRGDEEHREERVAVPAECTVKGFGPRVSHT